MGGRPPALYDPVFIKCIVDTLLDREAVPGESGEHVCSNAIAKGHPIVGKTKISFGQGAQRLEAIGVTARARPSRAKFVRLENGDTWGLIPFREQCSCFGSDCRALGAPTEDG
jgi:hypothetical protein